MAVTEKSNSVQLASRHIFFSYYRDMAVESPNIVFVSYRHDPVVTASWHGCSFFCVPSCITALRTRMYSRLPLRQNNCLALSGDAGTIRAYGCLMTNGFPLHITEVFHLNRSKNSTDSTVVFEYLPVLCYQFSLFFAIAGHNKRGLSNACLTPLPSSKPVHCNLSVYPQKKAI